MEEESTQRGRNIIVFAVVVVVDESFFKHLLGRFIETKVKGRGGNCS
jgi:hypothetical protein